MRMICHAHEVTELILFKFLFVYLSSGPMELNISIFIDVNCRSCSVLVISPISTHREHNHRQYDFYQIKQKLVIISLSFEYGSG